MPCRHALVVSTFALGLAACATLGRGEAQAQAASHPSLVVVLTVDQLGSDYVERFTPNLGSGLRRLLDESAVWPYGAHDHAVTETARTLHEFPSMDSLTLAFALEGVCELALGASSRRTDLLAISLSTTDAVLHRYNPDSREIQDQLLRLDYDLGWFLDSLAALRGDDDLLMVLTVDHGVAPYHEHKSPWYPNHGAPKADQQRAMHFVKRQMHAHRVDSAAVTFDDGFKIVDCDAFQRARRDPDAYAAPRMQEIRRVNGVLRADLITDLAPTS